MDTVGIDALLMEAEEARKPVLAAIEGFQHKLEWQDILASTRQKVQEALDAYKLGLSKLDIATRELDEAKAAVEDLLKFGFPVEPTFEVDRDILADIDQNMETERAARSKFTVRALTTSAEIKVWGEEPQLPVVESVHGVVSVKPSKKGR